MASETLLGIDLGTTVLKVALFDAGSGRLVAAASRRLAVEVFADGKREQNTAGIDRALRQASAELRAKSGCAWSRVSGIGLASQAGSMLIAERATGRARTPLVLWNDTRAAAFYARLKERKAPSYWRRLTWRDEPGWGLARLLWLRGRRPGLFADRNICAGAGEYLYFGLTGCWRQDAGNALQAGCYDVPRRRLSAKQLGLAGVPVSFVAPMREDGVCYPLRRAAARRLGLPEGIPVAGPFFDQEAGYAAVAGAGRRPLQCSLGTAWVGNFAMGLRTQWTSPFQLVVPAFSSGGWLVVQPLLTGNVALDWALRTLVHEDIGAAIARMGAVLAGDFLPPHGLVALPWLNQPNQLDRIVPGGGAFLGIGAGTSRADLLRAMMSSMVHEMARVFTEVARRRIADAVILSGGASREPAFGNLFAAAFRPLPVRIVRDQDTAGARGAVRMLASELPPAETVAVKCPPAGFCARFDACRDRYLIAFDRLCGGIGTGGPIRIGRRMRRNTGK